MRIAIVGAGIGGLAAAVALQRVGAEVVVFEQASALGEVGAGIQMTPNAVRVLDRLGLGAGLHAVGVQPARTDSRRWRDFSVIGSQPLDEAFVARFGHPWYTVHRAELHALLVGSLDGGVVQTDRRLTGLDDTGPAVRLTFADGRTATADAVLGADGIHSQVQAELFGPSRPHFTGNTAFRGLVPADEVADLGIPVTTNGVLGPDRHFVCYYVASGQLLNWVAIAPSESWTVESWTAPASVDDALAEYDGWAPVVRRLISMAGHAGRTVYRWALNDRDPLPEWGRGRVTLLGDAAHPMLPFLAQGAAQAIEDAAVLARCVERVADLPTALRTYESLRRERTARVQLGARRNSVVFHLPDGPEQAARDARLAEPADIHPNAWIFGYDADEATAHL